MQYAVPVKAGAEPLEYALNWPALAGSDFTANALAASALAASDVAPGPKVKWQNARRFYDAVVANRGSSR